MPYLEIFFPDSERERHDLTKQAAVTIGRHSSNDISVDESDVGVMHCRISWTGAGYEAVSAGPTPLEVNGMQMLHARLKAGDVLRFGSCDIRYRDSDQDGVNNARPGDVADSGGLKPVSEELPVRKPTSFRPAPPAPLPATPPVSAPAPREPKPHRAPAPIPVAVEIIEPVLQPVEVIEEPVAGATLSPRLRNALRKQGTRPGEEDLLRSPLVLGLGGFAVVLFLASVIFYFISARQTAQQAFDAAKELYQTGDYHGSIAAFDLFLERHPKGPLSGDARRLLLDSEVRQYVDGSATQFEQGLQALRNLIEDQRDRDGFETQHAAIFQHARTISLGSAALAAKQMSSPLLEISRQARTLVTSFAPKDVPPTETLLQIDQAIRDAEKEILKDDVYREALAAIDQALEKKQAIRALQLRRDLLVRYPQFENDKRLAAKMQSMLQLEQQQVRSVDAPSLPVKQDHAWPVPTLSLAFQSRTKPDEVAVGRAILVVAQDCCYGIEMITGQPLWRRVVGFDLPFFPIVTPTSGQVLLYDTRHRELVCLELNTGKFLWRLPLDAGINGQPLLSNGTLYVATQNHLLLSIQAATGDVTETLQFSQSVSGPAALENGQELVVVGNEETVYLLSRHPLACTSVLDLGQKPGSIKAPLLTAADYVLLAENGASRATLHLLIQNSTTHTLKAIASKSVVGRVTDPMVLRGRDLFVPSTGQRVSAFIVSDDAGQPPLTASAVYAGDGSQSGPTFLLTGPDRQLWMATGALQRLRLATDTLQADSKAVSPGIATQPLLFLNGQLFHARRRPLASTVTVSRTDREELTSDWQANVGGQILTLVPVTGGDSGMMAVTDAGLVYRIPMKSLNEGGFYLNVATRLPLPASQQGALMAGPLTNSRIAVVCGAPEPRLWILNASGQIEATHTLPAPPEAAPVALGADVVVPLSGKIVMIRGGGRSPVQEFALPTDLKTKWVRVFSVSDTQLAAASSDGVLRWLKLEQSPRPFLAEAAQVKLGESMSMPLATGQGVLAAVTADRTFHLFEAAQFQLLAKQQMERPVTGPVGIAGGLLLIETDQSELHAVTATADMKSKWTVPLPKTSVAGVISQPGSLVVALQNGLVLTLNPETGDITQQFNTANALSALVESTGTIFAVSVDGSLIRLQSKSQ